jgi:hypothetical protein
MCTWRKATNSGEVVPYNITRTSKLHYMWTSICKSTIDQRFHIQQDLSNKDVIAKRIQISTYKILNMMHCVIVVPPIQVSWCLHINWSLSSRKKNNGNDNTDNSLKPGPCSPFSHDSWTWICGYRNTSSSNLDSVNSLKETEPWF